ncbi:hypothetical protein HYS50_02410 [Candidatus Woesearchaeota archaeon]|nr:hypothetical protein [Candidatus Woesearchaeota archaeon]
MAIPIPNWIMQRYARLWGKFKDKPFTHEDAVKLLKDNKQLVSVFLSDLRKAGWVEVSLDQNDTRIRTYKLREPNEAVKEMA